MDSDILTLDGYLVSGQEKYNIKIFYDSKFSVQVKIDNDNEIFDGQEFNQLILSRNGSSFEFGQCRFSLGTTIKGMSGKVIFTNDIYDFNSFFFENRIINLKSMSNNLQLILNQKNNVHESFKNYTANLSYDLQVYKHFFDDLDNKINNEPDDIKKTSIETVLKTEGKEFTRFFDLKLKELEDIISGYSREEHQQHGFYFRKQVWNYITCSEFMSRTNNKPRGYVGDSEMMKMVYENDYRGDSIFSKVLYKFSIEHPAAQAVRNRRVMVPKLLNETRTELALDESKRFRFISIACGPSSELNDIFKSHNDINRLECSLLDQDPVALNEASDTVLHIEKKLKYIIHANYLRESVRTMLRTHDLREQWGSFHFIYSMGLFDYLTPPVAKMVLEKLFTLLEPGGKILIGNFHPQNVSRYFMEYWHDWVLYYRTEEDLKELLSDINAEDISIFFEDTRCQMFLTARKPE